MENLKDPEVQAWMKAQNDYTQAVLTRIPGREKLLARISELNQSAPAQVSEVHRLPGDLYFYKKLLVSEDTWKLYIRRGLDGNEKLVADPERMTLLQGANQKKGKNAIQYFAPSPDGKFIAVGIAPGSSETDVELHVIDVATSRETADVIVGGPCVDGLPPNWLPDNHAFVYGRLQKLAPDTPATEVWKKYKTYLHVLGTDPEKDPPVFGYGVASSVVVDPSLIATVQTPPGSRFALGMLNTTVSPNSAFYIAPIEAIYKSNPEWHKVADLSEGVKSIALHGDDLYLLTYKDAPRYKILRTDARKPDFTSAKMIVPPGESVITSMSAAQDALYVRLMDGGISRMLRIAYGAKPQVERLVLPFEGSIDLADSDPRVEGTLFSMTSWIKAPTVYAYDPRTKHITNTRLQPAGPYDNPNVELMEVKARSYDGAQVPLSIIRPKGLKLDGSNPTWLLGYGAYGNSIDAVFEPWLLAWHEKGGVFAICHVRGGGEYGEEWHLAGKGPTKLNTWRDFIACAELLIDQKYTSSAHLAGWGSSAGGILIGRAITERPSLFAAVVDQVGISDLLRSETSANGETNIPEFGSTKTEEGFKALYAMSPYEHVKDKTSYPAVLLETGINDAVIDPWHLAKMAARLQASTISGKPVLLRIDYAAGHTITTKTRFSETMADTWSFLLWQLGAPEFQPR
jgi:prolyl oligopeptidase